MLPTSTVSIAAKFSCNQVLFKFLLQHPLLRLHLQQLLFVYNFDIGVWQCIHTSYTSKCISDANSSSVGVRIRLQFYFYVLKLLLQSYQGNLTLQGIFFSPPYSTGFTSRSEFRASTYYLLYCSCSWRNMVFSTATTSYTPLLQV